MAATIYTGLAMLCLREIYTQPFMRLCGSVFAGNGLAVKSGLCAGLSHCGQSTRSYELFGIHLASIRVVIEDFSQRP
jgi:hypothetical protein